MKKAKIVANSMPNGGSFVGLEGFVMPHLSNDKWIAVKIEGQGVIDFRPEELEITEVELKDL